MLNLITPKTYIYRYKPYVNESLGWKRSLKLFQKLPLYSVLIEKPKTKGLKNIDLLHELPFYNELN